MTNKRHRFRAFTLVEIATVVVVLAILAVFALPNLASQQDLTASAAARAVVGDLLYAQSQAIATGSGPYVYVNFAAMDATGSWGSYSAYSDATATLQTPIVDPVQNPLSQQNNYLVRSFGAGGSDSLASVALAGINLNNNPANTVLAFNELGQPYVAPVNGSFAQLNSGTISIQCGSNTVTISIEPSTGNLTVSQ